MFDGASHPSPPVVCSGLVETISETSHHDSSKMVSFFFPVIMLCLELPHLVLSPEQSIVSGLQNLVEQPRKVLRSAQYETGCPQKLESQIFLVDFTWEAIMEK